MRRSVIMSMRRSVKMSSPVHLLKPFIIKLKTKTAPVLPSLQPSLIFPFHLFLFISSCPSLAQFLSCSHQSILHTTTKTYPILPSFHTSRIFHYDVLRVSHQLGVKKHGSDSSSKWMLAGFYFIY